MYLIYRCLSSASAVIRSWFIYESQKSTTIAFSRNLLYTFYSRNPTCEIPPCLGISNRKYPPCPQNSINVNPPSPPEILKAVRGIGMDIFWNRPYYWTIIRLCALNSPVSNSPWPHLYRVSLDLKNIFIISKIQLVVYYQCCVLIGWATSRLFVIAH